jgi:hypothetical protein
MMKKLFALLVVLAFCGAANAALVATDDSVQVAFGSDIDTGGMLGLYTTTAITGYEVGIKVISGDVALNVSAITFPQAFDFAGKLVNDPAYAVRVTASQFFTGAVGPAQLVNNIAISGTGTLEFFDILAQGESMGTVTVIPEPMTIALLGLGGLFLRRRK